MKKLEDFKKFRKAYVDEKLLSKIVGGEGGGCTTNCCNTDVITRNGSSDCDCDACDACCDTVYK